MNKPTWVAIALLVTACAVPSASPSEGTADSEVAAMAEPSGVAESLEERSGPLLRATDPNLVGPAEVASVDLTLQVATTGDAMTVRAFYPVRGSVAAPVVLVAHGYLLDSKLYDVYAKRLASYGYLAVVPNFPNVFGDANNMRDVRNLTAALDWALSSEAPVQGDANKVGVMGHSRGGKNVILLAAGDTRIKAVLGLDPVESKPGGVIRCNVVTECPPATAALATLDIPILILGETRNASGGLFGQSCAPANVNFQVLYAAAKRRAVAVEVLGATHMSFHSDPNCFPLCTLCGTATVDNRKVLGLAQAYTVAFFERHLAGDLQMDAFITGSVAQQRYVSPGLARIESK